MTTVTRYDGQVIAGSIKAWNVDKGFGFAAVEDGGDDIFMHQSVIEVDDNKYRAVCPGTKVEVTYFDRDGKHTASKVTGVGGTSFKGFSSKGEAANQCINRPAGSSSGRVKWYNTEKGFGFILPDEGGSSDIFFSIKDVENQQPLQSDEPVVYFLAEVDSKVKATKVKSLSTAPRGGLVGGGPYGGLPSGPSPMFPSQPPGPYGYAPGQGGPQYPQYPPQYPPQQPMYPPQGPYGQQMGAGMQMGYGGPSGPASGLRTGSCKWYNEAKGFGFIIPSEGGKDIYFREVTPPPAEGDPLEFEIKVMDGKPAAVNIVQTKNRKRKVMDPGFQGQQVHSDPYAPQSKAPRASYPPGPGHAPQAAHDPYGGPSAGQGNYGQQPAGAPYAPNPAGSPYPGNPQQGSAYGYPPQNAYY